MDLHRQVDEVTERYNEDRALRPMVAVIPFIGGPLDAFITARASRLQRERFEHFVEEVRAAYARLDEDKLDQDLIQSEEFFELFVSTVERVTKAYETEKLCALTNAFVNATTTEGSEGPIKEIVVRVTDDLTDSHMRLLRVVADRECAFTRADGENAVDYTDLEHLRVAAAELTDVDIVAVTADLRNLGLLGNWWRGRHGGLGRYGGLEGRDDRFFLTDFGRRFIWFIRSPAADARPRRRVRSTTSQSTDGGSSARNRRRSRRA